MFCLVGITETEFIFVNSLTKSPIEQEITIENNLQIINFMSEQELSDFSHGLKVM